MQEANTPEAVEAESRERRGMTFEELPIELQLRVIHAERWVAWADDDHRSIMAAGDTFEEVDAAVRRAGAGRAIYEWVPPPIRSCGR